MSRRHDGLCSICGVRPKASSKSRSSGLTSYCAPCNSQKTREYFTAHPDRVFENNLKRYGIDATTYWALCRRQAGLCAICERPERMLFKGRLKRLCVDHDKLTGEIRGLLCSDCNTSIGKMGHAAWVLRSAIDYLGPRTGSFSESTEAAA